MKTNKEIENEKLVYIVDLGADGGFGYVSGLDIKKQNKLATVVWSFGGGWDHVSVSFPDRCPTWDEMCRTKNIFFRKDECCVQYHPSETDYVNQHPYCLHIWKPQSLELPNPPTWMVGTRDGESVAKILFEKAEGGLNNEDTDEIVTAIINYIAAIVANLIKIVPQSAQPAVMKDICAAFNDAIDKAKSEKVN